ncbi:high nitrogen upregulated cytochrome P450 monooxygenase 2 [Cyathus striatus]|nr:high nitrogen upregulated cytochrome P450 monooxygenase 2 [Cyathus striatus]
MSTTSPSMPLFSAVITGLGLLAVSPLVPAALLWSYYAYEAITIAYLISYATLVVSILAYRLSPFHPLSKYPGPTLAKFTKFWGVYQNHTGKLHVTVLNLHRRYGSVVRIGPNELSITDVDAVQPVLGLNGMNKGPMWEGRRTSNTNESLISIRDAKLHQHRRKYWSKGLNVASVKEYQPTLKIRVDELVSHLKNKALEKAPVNLAEWMSYFAYDFMGDMGFGAGFGLMQNGDPNNLWKIMENGIGQHVPWMSSMMLRLPWVVKGLVNLRKFAIEQTKKRIERGSAHSYAGDLSSHLLGEVESSLSSLSRADYVLDAMLVIVAGSDTTAITLSSIFFHLASNPEIMNKLREEVEEYYPGIEGVLPSEDMSRLADMPLLNGVINEALRLTPAVPTSLQRFVDEGTGGKLVGSTYIPGGTAVSIPPFSIHRDRRYFSPDPDHFMPERWFNKDPSIETNHEAFIPFSTGPMNCAGRLLAQLELRVVVSSLVRELDIVLEDEWNKAEWDQALEDAFVFKKGKLPVVLTLRSEKA